MPKPFTNHAAAAATPERPRRYASKRQAAQYIGASIDTLERMIERGELKVYRLGQRVVRIDLNELDALADRNAGRRPERIGA